MADNPSILQEVDIMRDTYTKYLDRQMQLAGNRSANILRKNKNYATSQLIQSISGSAYSEGDNIIGSFGANTSYAETIEDGVSREEATPAKIMEWALRKIHLGHLQMPKNLKSFAFLTARKINETGKIKSANPYIQPSADILIQKLSNDFPLELN